MCRVRESQGIVDGPRKEKINFSGIPLYLKDQILQKMNYKTYVTLMMTGREAGELSERNDKFTYALPKYRMTIKEDKVSFVYGKCNRIEWIPFEMCSKMRLRPQIVEIQDSFISAKTCEFLLKLEEIPTLECAILGGDVPHIAEFFKKAKIETLKMTKSEYANQAFQYDTSNVDKVEFVDRTNLLFSTPWWIFSIKARRSLTLTSMGLSLVQMQRYITEIRNGADKPDLVLKNCTIFGNRLFGFAEIKHFLSQNFLRENVRETIHVMNVGGEPRLKVYIKSFTSPFNITFKVL